MTLRKLKSSRKEPLPGDIFVFSPENGRFYFGRVVRNDAQFGIDGGRCLLCYAFDVHQERPSPVPKLKGEMLVPPFLINRLPWSKGYFMTVGHSPLSAVERSKHHYFRGTDGKFYDEYHKPVERTPKAWSLLGLSSYKSFERKVASLLGSRLH